MKLMHSTLTASLMAFFILGPLSIANAQSPAMGSTNAVKNPTSKSHFSPQMRLWNDSFISSDYEATAAKNFGFLGASLKTPTDSPWQTKMDIDAAFAFNAPLLSYLNFKDIYFDLSLGEDEAGSATRLQVGRKRSDWSQADQRWNLGVWEPVFKWNPLNAERQGLSGFFLLFPFEYAEVEVLGSPLYLPNQGPSFQVSDKGEFIKGSPWFLPPAQSVHIWSQTSQVEYNLIRPNEAQVVMQKSYATRARFKMDSFYIQGSYAYKPMNELPLGYDGVLDIARDKGVVEIITSIQYHEVTGADLEWHSKSFKLGISGFRDKPFGEAEFSDAKVWTRPVYHEAVGVSPYIDVNLAAGWIGKVQYLSIKGGEVEEIGPLASPTRASFTRRYPYTQAQSVELQYEGRMGLHRPWQSSLNYTVSTKNQFDLIRWRGVIQLSKLWNVFSETSLVRAQAVSQGNQNEIVQFENHDRLLAGVGYVF